MTISSRRLAEVLQMLLDFEEARVEFLIMQDANRDMGSVSRGWLESREGTDK